MEVIKDYERRAHEAHVDTEVMTAIASVPIFAELQPAQLKYLADQMQARIYAPGERIFEKGTLGHELHVVLEGAVDLVAAGRDGQEHVAAKAGPSTSFGEIGFLTGEPRTLSAVTGSVPSLQLVLSRFDFERIATLAPEIGYTVFEDLLRVISSRMQSLPAEQRNFLMWGYHPPVIPAFGAPRVFAAVLSGGLVVTAVTAWAGWFAGGVAATALALLFTLVQQSDPVESVG